MEFIKLSLASQIPGEKGKFPGDQAKLASWRMYWPPVSDVKGKEQNIRSGDLSQSRTSVRGSHVACIVLPRKGSLRSCSLGWKSVLSQSAEGSCFCLPLRFLKRKGARKGMHVRMGTSDLKSGFYRNPPTVLRSHKMLGVCSQNQMRRWALWDWKDNRQQNKRAIKNAPANIEPQVSSQN